jgi:hypothetical protein
MGLTQKLGTIPLAILTDASNNVGIGAAPSGSYKLEVTGTAKVSSTLLVSGALTGAAATFSGTLTANGSIQQNSSQDLGTSAYFSANVTNGFRVLNAANTIALLSITNAGAATFNGTLQVTTTSNNGITITTNDIATLKMSNSGGSTKNWGFATTNLAASDFGIYQSTSNGGDPISAGTAKLYFSGTGNVGIGTSSPGEKLSVTGGISFTSYLLVGAAGYMGVGNQIQGGWTSVDLLILNNNNGGKIAINTTNGSAYNGLFLVSGATSWSPITSDVRTKKNFETTQGLVEVLQIEPTKYHLITDDNDSVKRLGFKAQNLQPLIPEMVIPTGNKADDGSDYLTIVPDYLLPVLVKAIQEQNQIIQELNERLNKAGL